MAGIQAEGGFLLPRDMRGSPWEAGKNLRDFSAGRDGEVK